MNQEPQYLARQKTPQRIGMRKIRENVFLSVVALLMVAGVVAWFSYDRKPNDLFESAEDTFLIRADGNSFIAGDLNVTQVMGSNRVSAVLALSQKRGGWENLTAPRLRSLCGAVLTHVIRERNLARDSVYRVDFDMYVFPADDTQMYARRFPVSVRDGACFSEASVDMHSLAMPAPTDQWLLYGFEVLAGGDMAEAILVPFRDLDYNESLEVFDPARACEAVLSESYPSVSEPLASANVRTLRVSASKLLRGKMLGQREYIMWEFDVAGGVCLDKIDGVPS